MFGATGSLSSVDYRNAGEVYKTPAANIVITTVNPIADSDWELLNVNNLLIKSTNSPGTVSTDGSASYIFNYNSNSNHSMDQKDSNGKFVYGPYATPYTVLGYNISYGDVRSSSGGAHTHSMGQQTIGGNSYFPSYIRVGLYQRKINTSKIFELPIGTIVFAEDLTNTEGVVATSLYNGNHMCAVNIPNTIGTFYSGSNQFNFNIVSTISGAHAHNAIYPGPAPATQQTRVNAKTGANESDYAGIDHTHQGTASATITRKTISLRTYKVSSSNVYITRGMIFGFSSTNIPPDWYICDGSVINGYTTPRIVDRYLMFGNALLSSHDKISGNDNYITVSGSLNSVTWEHRHGTDTIWQDYTNTTGKYFHGPSGSLAAHGHAGQTVTTYYENDRYNLLYCIYLP